MLFGQEAFFFHLSLQGNNIKMHRTVLFGVELGLLLREEHRLTVFERRVLGEISGSKREKVTGHWEQHRIDYLHDLYPHLILFR